MTSDAQTHTMNQCQFVPHFRARDLGSKSPRTKPFHTRQQRLAIGYVSFRWRTRRRRVLLSRGSAGIILILESMMSRIFRIQNACQTFQRWADCGSYS
jgi:hypothetical protein